MGGAIGPSKSGKALGDIIDYVSALRARAAVAKVEATTAYEHLQRADALLHDMPGNHAEWAHGLVHQAAAHLSAVEEIRAQAASEAKECIGYDFVEIARRMKAAEADRVPDKLRLLSEAATPGEWHHVMPFKIVPAKRTIYGPLPAARVDYVSTWAGSGTPPGHRVVIAKPGSEEAPRSADMALIVAAVNDVRTRLAVKDAQHVEKEQHD